MGQPIRSEGSVRPSAEQPISKRFQEASHEYFGHAIKSIEELQGQIKEIMQSGKQLTPSEMLDLQMKLHKMSELSEFSTSILCQMNPSVNFQEPPPRK